MSATVACLPLLAALHWAETMSGRTTGHVDAVFLDLDPIPAVTAVPDQPPAQFAQIAPDQPQPETPPDPATERPAEEAPVVPEPAPQIAPLAPEAAPMVADAPPAPVQTAALTPSQRPQARPAAKPSAKPEPAPAAASGSTTQQAQAPTASRQGTKELESVWGAAIRKKVERRKAYPKTAKGVAGRVVVQMTVAANGGLLSASVAKSSGHPALDAAALTAVQRASPLPAAPAGLTVPSHSFALPMDFAP